MTPGARVAAAIDILDEIFGGMPAEKALTGWARRSRFAGSKDRAAVRDHVFDALRNLQSFQAAAGTSESELSGRAVMIGAARCQNLDIDALFSGIGHAPFQLDGAERAAKPDSNWQPNLPMWIYDRLAAQLGVDVAQKQATLLSKRAPVTLRANLEKTTRDTLCKTLEEQGYQVTFNALSDTAITVREPVRGLTNLATFHDGLFEMQDASSQAVVDALDLSNVGTILDYCAGGGGKTLAIAAQYDAQITAHDAYAARLSDLPARAKRAGARISIASDIKQLSDQRFDLVLVDAPCSGSGSWRRAPDAKWLLTPQSLEELQATQREILTSAQRYVAPGGVLAYATCSIFEDENAAQSHWFIETFPGWILMQDHNWRVSEHGDGFYLATLKASEPV